MAAPDSALLNNMDNVCLGLMIVILEGVDHC